MIRECLAILAVSFPCMMPALPSIGISLCLVHLMIRMRQEAKRKHTSPAPHAASIALTPALG